MVFIHILNLGSQFRCEPNRFCPILNLRTEVNRWSDNMAEFKHLFSGGIRTNVYHSHFRLLILLKSWIKQKPTYYLLYQLFSLCQPILPSGKNPVILFLGLDLLSVILHQKLAAPTNGYFQDTQDHQYP